MPRSTLPLFSSMRALKHISLPLVFDADGLPIDERVDFAGLSSRGFVYRVLRDIEALGIRKSSVVLTRTDKASQILYARAGAGTSESIFFRVNNGRDSEKFALTDGSERARIRRELRVDPEAPLIIYSGSLGEQYCLPEMLAFFRHVLAYRSDTRLLFLTGSPEIAAREIDNHDDLKLKIEIKSVEPDKVPSIVASADLGLGLRRTSFSMQGVSPVKVGEYLLCGVPLVATKGIGDTDGITEEIGYLMKEHTQEALEDAACWFVESVLADREGFRTRARELGAAQYSLQASVDSYRRALEAVETYSSVSHQSLVG
ncbi:hypothetical protein [Marinobacter sp. M-5]|uniref:hypothetical protein n=1 Tax=Marinobacter sp. M-5 TaxID=3081089 RepID=UPI00293C85B7|nr:hypothetical protein [Marinobacter sp. M-5]MDV3503094.1 hypothetical protein [Marinobacter sp. M-5]